MRNFSHRNAFTLIEILVVLIILSILAAMVTTAVSGVRTTAREARTKRIISVVDSVIAEHYEQLRYRPLPVEIPALYRDIPGQDSLLGWEVLADETARVRLMMLRDLQRLELPDRYSDIVNLSSGNFEPPIVIRAAVSQVVKEDGTIVKRREDLGDRKPAFVDWYGDSVSNKQPNQKQDGYRRRMLGSDWTVEHQGAECLYMILSTSFVGGQPAIGAIPDSNIADTDDDGMLEILDGWGQPLQFVRWPVGLTPSNKQFNVDFETTVNLATVDDYDLFRADPAYLKGVNKADVLVRDVNDPRFFLTPDQVWNQATQYRPWSMRPLVFSAGEDGESGVAVNPGDQPGLRQYNFSYASSFWYWPVTPQYFGIEAEGRGSGNIAFIDPYLRIFSKRNQGQTLPGELIGKNNADELKKAFNQSVDDITNYQLQVAP